MKTLAISDTYQYLSYAIFDRDTLVKCENVFDKSTNVDVQTLDYYNNVKEIILNHKITFIVVHAIDYSYLNRKDVLSFTKQRTILRLLSAMYNLSYTEVETKNFDTFFFGDNLKGKALEIEKINVINSVFELNLKHDTDDLFKQGQHLANALVLGTAFTQDKLKIRKRVDF